MGNINYICYDCGYLLRFYECEELEKVKKAEKINCGSAEQVISYLNP